MNDEDFHNMDCGIAGGFPHPASAHDEGMCLDGPYDEDVEPTLDVTVSGLQNMTMEEYAEIRESLIRSMQGLPNQQKATAWMQMKY